MAARVLAPFPLHFYLAEYGEDHYAYFAWTGVAGQLASLLGLYPRNGQHFPYGLPVEPD